MSTPITFSGFNNIDFNVVLNALMAQASQPLTSLQTQQKDLQSKVTTFDTLTSRVAALRSAATALNSPQKLTLISGTSSDPQAVGVSAGPTASPAHYDVIVNELARAQVTVSATGAPDSNTTIVANGGTITIGGVAVTLTGDSTLQQVAAAINATAGIGVTAAVIHTSPTTYKLALTGNLTGAANAFTVTNGLTGGTGLTFTDTDNNGTIGDSAADNAVSATDASLLVNNIPVTGTSNDFTDVLPGVTLTAAKKDPATTVGVDVAPDSEALEAKITEFIDAYNEIVKFIGEQRSASVAGTPGSLGRDPILRQLHNSLRSLLVGTHGTMALTRLAEAGVELTSNGQLKLNKMVFDEAVRTQPADLKDLFGGTNGAFVNIGTMLDSYSQANGLISTSKKRLESQIAMMDSQIANMQARLAIQREALQRQFAEADAIMSRLNSQSSSLQNLGSGMGSSL